MSTPVHCTITLAELLRLRPTLCNDLGTCLDKLGIKDPKKLLKMEKKETKWETKTVEPVPINKVGDYYEGEDGNTTLPIEYNGVKNLAILDSGAGVAIATKSVWEQWGRPANQKNKNETSIGRWIHGKATGSFRENSSLFMWH